MMNVSHHSPIIHTLLLLTSTIFVTTAAFTATTRTILFGRSMIMPSSVLVLKQHTPLPQPGQRRRLVVGLMASTTTTTTEGKEVTTTDEASDDNYSQQADLAAAAAANVINDDNDLLPEEIVLLEEARLAAEQVVQELVDDSCELDEWGRPVDEICVNEEAKTSFRRGLGGVISKTLQLMMMRGADDDTTSSNVKNKKADEVESELERRLAEKGQDEEGLVSEGELLEKGWEERANSSSIRRNAEVWNFALKAIFRALKPRKMRKSGKYTAEDIKQAQIDAATYIRDGLLRLGPSFVKLGQVASTRTDVLPTTYTDILKTLTDEVPGFSGKRAKKIASKELGRPVDQVFQNFSKTPLKAASLGQVHTAFYKGKKVAIKVQRAGLKDLFDVDLKNLRKLAVLLEKFDPKSDGADRDWVSIYDESERLLSLEIDYLNEARNAERFARDFSDTPWVRVPQMYHDLSTPRLLVMEFVESFKLTNMQRIEQLGLDRKVLAKRVADSFLRQIIETAYFHCDPHSGNLCVDEEGNLVFYDFGQMDELKPNVRKGLRTFCTALFAGGPKISDTQLARNAKELVKGVEQAGVLSKGADRLAVEKLARYFMRSFKDSQLGKKGGNIKETLGADLQTLTDNNSFRFPSTFTFVFRAFVSIEGIGKELDPDFDIGKLAQPFVEKFTASQKGYKSEPEKNFAIFQKITGLNAQDIETAVMQPRKIAYVEETLRAMETGDLKVRVRSLENEKALERISLRQSVSENILMSSMLLNVAGLAGRSVVGGVGLAGAVYFALQTLVANSKIKKFDKTQLKYVNKDFVEATGEEDED